MILDENRKKFEKSDIRIFDYDNMIVLVKKMGAKGNLIPNWKGVPTIIMDEKFNVIEEVYSDCPRVSIRFENDTYQVSVWGWVPGPGPGDFELDFKTESEAVDFASKYFFSKNKYFTERLNYHLKENS